MMHTNVTWTITTVNSKRALQCSLHATSHTPQWQTTLEFHGAGDASTSDSHNSNHTIKKGARILVRLDETRTVV